MEPRVGIILPAAGRGLRFGGELPKQYHPLGTEPVMIHTVRTCLQIPNVQSIVIAVSPQDTFFDGVMETAGISDPRIVRVDGDSERQYSIQRALDHPSLHSVEIIVVHDAVRPLASVSLFERVITMATLQQAVIPVVPVADTVKRVDHEGRVVETLPRADLRLVQTPQAFSASVLRAAYVQARMHDRMGTDDASLVEASGVPVYTVDGEPWNMKITTASDIATAESIFSLNR